MDNPAYVTELDNVFGTRKNGKSEIATHTYEEAVGLTGVGRFHYTLLLICGTCFMAVMAESMGVSMILPLVKCDLGTTQSEQGLLGSAAFIGIVLSSHMMGFMADTTGRVRTLRFSLSLAVCATIISAFSVNTWMLIAFRFLNGFFISGCQACVFSLLGEFHSNRTRVRYVTLLAIFLPLAMICMPAFGYVILPLQLNTTIVGLNFTSWRLFLLINTIFSLAGLAGLFTLPETPKYLLVHGEHDAALDILRRVYAKNSGNKPESFPVKGIVLQTGGANFANIHGIKDALKMIWSQTVPLFYKVRCLQTFNICISLFVVYGIAQGLFMWFPTILNELISKQNENLRVCEVIGSMNLTTTTANDVCSGAVDKFMFQVLMIIGGVYTIIFLIFAYTIDIVGKVNLLIIWMVLCCASTVIIQFVSEFAAVIVFLTLLMSIGNCGGVIGTIAMEFYPTQFNAMGMCFAMMIGRLGAVAGGNIFGLTLFNYCDIVIWTLVGIIVMIIALATLLPEKKREKKMVKGVTK